MGVTQDYERAFGTYRRASEAGYPPAQYELGCLYVDGHVLKQAVLWYRKAADQGNAGAQNNHGALYAKGQGVRRSDFQAVRGYRLVRHFAASAKCRLWIRLEKCERSTGIEER